MTDTTTIHRRDLGPLPDRMHGQVRCAKCERKMLARQRGVLVTRRNASGAILVTWHEHTQCPSGRS